MRGAPHAIRVKPSAEALEFFMYAVFQLVVLRKTASSECQKMEGGGC